MPQLTWIGKAKVINHHLDVPFRTLNTKYTFNAENSPNKIIHGDNLEALKALLPEYEGKVKCIYIDPPYNTGNESWVYNDNVSDPRLQKWLGNVVGKESEDLSRHDKWLCMMYPRLVLLRKLLSEDGAIFISIDNNEYNYLSLILEEIFGKTNHIETLIWKKSYGGGAKSKHVVNLHEYVFFYAKNLEKIPHLALPSDDNVLKYYKYTDAKVNERGPYRLQPLATTSMDERPNLRYPIVFEGEEIWPDKQWQWSKDRVYKAIDNDEIVIERKNNNKWSVNYKQYLKSAEGEERGKKLYSIIEGIYTQQGTNELRKLIEDNDFSFPKPSELVKTFIQLVTDKDSLVLDSFAGSGTTAHAVLNLNKEDGGNRRFILVEQEDYADSLTTERVKRVIQSNGETGGTGDNFEFIELGEPIFDEAGDLNPALETGKIRSYIWFTETGGTAIPQVISANAYYLGNAAQTGYYFYYEPDRQTVLDDDFLSMIDERAAQYVIYADKCYLSDEFLRHHNITFKKIPRDITRL